VVEVLIHVIVELFSAIDSEFSRDTVTTEDVLLEKFLDSHGAYVCDRLHLDPLCKILNWYNNEGVVALSWS
jgi:hypothetical protein